MAAVDYFLKIAGIEGESLDDKHRGEIEIESFSWGVQNVGSMAHGGGGGEGKASFRDLTFSKLTDKTSPVLMRSCATGVHLKEAVLVARKAGEQQTEFMKITISDVLVSSYQNSGQSTTPPSPILTDVAFIAPNLGTGDASIIGPEGPQDAVSLNFTKVEFLEGAPQRILVGPAVSGQLMFDAATGEFIVQQNEDGTLMVGTDGGRVSRGVQEFDVTSLLGLINLPSSNAKLSLEIAEIREGAQPHLAPDPNLHFDVLMYAPADLVLTPEDLTRPGKRLGSLHLDPRRDPTSLTLDLTNEVREAALNGMFGIRLQLRGAPVVSVPPSPIRDAVANDLEEGDERPGRDASASFALSLNFDTA